MGLRTLIEQANVLSQARNAAGTLGVPVGVQYVNGGQSVNLQAYVSATGAPDAEAAEGTDLSAYTVRIVFTGR